MSVIPFAQVAPQSQRSLNDFSVPFSNTIFNAVLEQNLEKHFVVPNEGSFGMGVSSGANNKFIAIFKTSPGSIVYVDPTAAPVINGGFQRGTSELIVSGMARYVEGNTTLYFLTPDSAGAFVQAVLYYIAA